MAQAGYTPLSLYYSTTGSAVPVNTNLVNGELAINIADGKLYYKDNTGTVQLLASKAGASGDVVGPASATDNAVVRFDGTTGKLVQNSAVTIADTTGDITGGAYNKVTITAPASSATLTIANGKTLTANATLTLAGTDATTMTFPSTSASIARTDAGQTFTGDQVIAGNLTMNAQGDVRFADSDSSNWVAFQGPATVASNVTWTLPNADGTSGQFLSTDGAGILSWATASGGGGGGGTSVTVTQITATASQTTFNVTYTVGQISVYLNGALLASADYTATNGTSVVLGTGAASGDIFTAVVYSTVTGLTINTASPFNTWVGSSAGAANTTGANNVAVGYQAMDANTTGQQNVALGSGALGANTTANYNVGIGYFALNTNTTGSNNVAVGYGSLYLNTTGADNTAVGYATLFSNTTGTKNLALGRDALYSNTTGTNNVALGYGALDVNTTASNNTAIGTDALGANTTGSSLTAVGSGALDANTTGSDNTAIGINALGSNTTAGDSTAVGSNALATSTGESNTAVGAYSLNNNTTGTFNTALGRLSLYNNTTGAYNTAVGYTAMDSCTTGTYNTAVGYRALDALNSGSSNIGIGYAAGEVITTGTGNVCIGESADPSAATGTNQIVIGNGVTGQGDSNVTFGSAAGGKIYNAYTVNATWTQTSDQRLKKNIKEDSLGLSFVNRLRPVTFEWKASNELEKDNPYYAEENKRTTGVTMHGLLAQEVKAALDAEGISTFNGWDQGPDGIQAISREMFITPLIKAVQELSAKCDALQAEVNQLKGN